MRRAVNQATVSGDRAGTRSAFALVDLVIFSAILTTLLSLAVPAYSEAIENAKVTLAVRDLEKLQEKVEHHWQTEGVLPAALVDLEGVNLVDPWGESYRYRAAEEGQSNAKDWRRIDRFLKPINRSYDLFSVGPDGQSAPPLSAHTSRDDIVRAGDGAYLGLAEGY